MSKIELSADLLKGFVQRLGYQYDATPGARNILGIRGARPVDPGNGCQLITNTPNEYNDTIVVFGEKGGGQDFCQCFAATVDPGRTWTLNPTNHKGCAHLVNGQYRYAVGTHKGHQALVQAAKVKVWRDQNKNYIQDGHDGIETGLFGINIHAGGKSPAVDAWSAGCQVIRGGWTGQPWKQFIQQVTSSPAARHWYSLVDGAMLAAYARDPGGRPEVNVDELSAEQKAALQAVLRGIAVLYAYQGAAKLGGEGGVTFEALLNRLRQAGVLGLVKLEQRPNLPAAADAADARKRMIEGFRQIYGHLPESGLDQTFHSQLNQLRHFGALAGV